MFTITTFVFYVLVVGTIRIMNITIEARDVIDNNVISAFSNVFIAAYIFGIVLTSVIVVAQFICIAHSLFPCSNLKTNGIMKTCIAGIDTIIMISFVMETQKTYTYVYLTFCIVLLCLSITRFILVRKVR